MTTPTTIAGQLKTGLKIGTEVHKEFELREATTADLFAAESVATADRSLAFNGALMTFQLVRIGSYKGPFDLDLIGKLKPHDFARIRAKQLELDSLGEDSDSDGKTS